MRELLIIDIGGLIYGIWKDEVHGIEALRALHRLPLMPSCIAGMSIINDRTVTLADLSVCVGHEPIRKQGTGNILLMSGAGKVAGFVIDHELDRISVPADAVHSMPDYLATPVIDTCVLHNDRLVPVINISALYARVQTADRDPLAASFSVPSATHEAPDERAFRVVGLGEERFAVMNAVVREDTVRPGTISMLHQMPQFVRGIVLRDGVVLPVIDLLQRIRMRQASTEALMLVAKVNEAVFGLLVDEDQGTIPRSSVPLKALPLLARSRWLQNALVIGEEVLPLIDLQELLAAPSDGTAASALSRHHAPRTELLGQFGKQDLVVTEFSLLGVRHALPKEEVQDVIGFKPYRTLPGLPPIVIGVAEHDGELLPVLDLAMVFDKRSLARTDWYMILIRNGDFRALVITEAVYGERQILREALRPLPILLPHRVVYGCYPDADAVRLVLNVHSLAVHFERTMARELIPALGIQPAVPGEPVKYQDAIEPITPSPIDEVIHQEDIRPVPRDAVAPAPVAETSDQRPVLVSETASQGIAEDVIEQEEEAIETPVQQKIEEPARDVGEREEAQPLEPVAVPEQSSYEQRPEPDPTNDVTLASGGLDSAQGRTPADQAHEEVEERNADTGAQTPQLIPEEAETISDAAATQSATPHDEPELIECVAEPSNAPYTMPAAERASVSQYDTKASPQTIFLGSSSNREAEATKKKLSGSAYVAIMLAVLVLLYLAGVMEKKGPLNMGERAEPKKSAAEAPSQVPNRQRGPLVLDIPANRQVDIDVYVVVEGDTLWGIAERFTGDPLNYPRLAGENRIADPDLIYPDQKVRLVRK